MKMHRLLRRQLDAHFGSHSDAPAGMARLFRDIDAEYRRADQDREALQRALALVGDLAQRQAVRAEPEKTGRRPAFSRALRRLFEQAPFAVVICDPALHVTSWNATAGRLFGHSAKQAVGHEAVPLLLPEIERGTARDELRGILSAGHAQRWQRLALTRTGEETSCDWTIVPLRDKSGASAGLAVLVQEPVAGRSDRFALALEAAGDGAWDWDVRGKRLLVSEAWRGIAGVAQLPEEPSAWLERIHPADREQFDAAFTAHVEGRSERFENEHRLLHRDGSWKWVLARGSAVKDRAGKVVRITGSLMDVTQRKAAADRMLHDALHDALTRLPNRSLFLDLVKRAFSRARRREGYRFAVLFLDLDRFKAVNDGLGHAAGDELLVQMSARLQTCLREGDTLARQGGDEFTVLLDDVREPNDATVVADRIHQVTTKPFAISGHEVFATTSIGIALSAPTYTRPEDLLLDADTAMYRAKAQGRARTIVFDATMRERAPQLLDLEADLRRALVREEFRVHYLPIVDVASGRIQGLEALIRWAHPKRGLVAPEHFVPFAEETGLIVPIGQWLLNQAGQQFQDCRRAAGATALTLNVNLSSKQLLQNDLLDHIDQVLEAHHLQPRDLVLELTENSFQFNDQAAARLAQLRARGVRLYMDDFGTGYSSLNALYRYQLDSLKIDRSLFTGGSPRGQAPELVRTIVSLARDLGKNVIAEGVETAEQFGFLREVGCGAA
ncbi:MAG TPA: EAL domain-containing protein, partial [Myxococcales bacterium]|nr:EAL domain-containing protein [Myxococcales bacterium]